LSAALSVGLLEPGAAVSVDHAGIDGLRALLTPETLRHWMAREVWRRQPATRLRPLVVPVLDSRPLTFMPGPLLWLTTAGDRVVLGLGDRLLDLPGEAHDFLSALLDADEPVLADRLKGLDAESRAVVLRRLLAEGVLAHGE
jgi:hypothetical protein